MHREERWLIRNAAIVEAREQGLKITVISQRFGLSYSRTREILRDAGVVKPSKLTKTKRNQQIRLDRLSGMSIEALMKKYDLAKVTIRRIIQKRRMRVTTITVKQGNITKVR